mmetsp:Transcript_78925/g.223360  ORF Transcript_78925/g.223360 Transcript_78925/m.223360 type:complete len:101 (-) Transcript_78925:756-1058(-)
MVSRSGGRNTCVVNMVGRQHNWGDRLLERSGEIKLECGLAAAYKSCILDFGFHLPICRNGLHLCNYPNFFIKQLADVIARPFCLSVFDERRLDFIHHLLF